MTYDISAVEAVKAYLNNREGRPDQADADRIAGAVALRLAEQVDTAQNATSAANASRELRQVLDLLRLTEPDAANVVDTLRARMDRRRTEEAFTTLADELAAAMDDDDPPPAVGAW